MKTREILRRGRGVKTPPLTERALVSVYQEYVAFKKLTTEDSSIRFLQSKEVFVKEFVSDRCAPFTRDFARYCELKKNLLEHDIVWIRSDVQRRYYIKCEYPQYKPTEEFGSNPKRLFPLTVEKYEEFATNVWRGRKLKSNLKVHGAKMGPPKTVFEEGPRGGKGKLLQRMAGFEIVREKNGKIRLEATVTDGEVYTAITRLFRRGE